MDHSRLRLARIIKELRLGLLRTISTSPSDRLVLRLQSFKLDLESLLL